MLRHLLLLLAELALTGFFLTPCVPSLPLSRAPEHMHEKRLVTSRMGNKKAATKGEKRKRDEKEAKTAESSSNAWKKSKCTDFDLLRFVDEGLL